MPSTDSGATGRTSADLSQAGHPDHDEVTPDRSAPSRGSTAIAYAILVVPIVVICAVWWPGHISADFIRSWNEATADGVTDWSVPAFGELVKLLLPVGVGPGWVLASQAVLLVVGSYGAFRAGFGAIRSAIGATILVLAPQTFGMTSWLIRDVWYTGFLISAVGLIVAATHARSDRARRGWLLAAAFALFLMTISRQNAIVALPPLAIAWIVTWRRQPARTRTERLRVVGWAAAFTVGTFVATAAVNVAISPVKSGPLQVLYIYDLAAISRKTGDDTVFPAKYINTTQQNVREQFSPFGFQTVTTGAAPSVRQPFTVEGTADLQGYWKKAILKHPIAWLQSRWDAWALETAITGPPAWAYHPALETNIYGWKISNPSLNDAGMDYVNTLATSPGNNGGPLQMPWLYLAIAVWAGAVLLRSRIAARRVLGWLCVASWTYQAGLFLAVMAIDYRLQFPLCSVLRSRRSSHFANGAIGPERSRLALPPLLPTMPWPSRDDAPRLTAHPHRNPRAALMRAGAPLAGVAFATVVVLLAGWREVPEMPAPGLDPSWAAGLHQGYREGLGFGRDLLFTYGPIAWLRQATYWYEDTGRLALAYTILCRLLLIVPLWWLARRQLGAVAATVVLALAVPFVDDPLQVVTATGAVWLVGRGASAPPRAQLAVIVGLGVLTGWTALEKLNSGVLAASVSVLAIALSGGRSALPRRLALWVGASIATLVVLWLLCGQAVRDLPAYVRGSAWIVSGFSEAMGTEVPGLAWHYWAIAAVWIAGLVATLALGPAARRERRGAAALWTVVTFFVFKAGFVRHDVVHSLTPFAVLGPLALALPIRRTPLGRSVTAILVLAPISVACVIDGVRLSQFVDPWPRITLAGEQASGLWSYARRAELRQKGLERVRAAYPLDDGALVALRGQRVDLWPIDTSIAVAYGLDWNPQPVFQSYQAYSRPLDALNREKLRSPSAPGRIVAAPWKALDRRLVAFDTPGATRAILCRYRPTVFAPAGMILSRDARRRCTPPTLIRSQRAAWGESIRVPQVPRDGIVSMTVDGAEVRGLERLRTAAYRSLERTIDLGSAGVHRVVPDAFAGGLPLADGALVGYGPPMVPQADVVRIDRQDRPRGGRPLTVAFYLERLVTDGP